MLISVKYRLSFLLLLLAGFVACKKDNLGNKSTGEFEWMRVLPDSLISSTDDVAYRGTNGKVLTDNFDNIILYYYNRTNVQSTILYCDRNGIPIWRKSIQNYVALDIVKLNDNRFAVAGYDSLNSIQGIKVYLISKLGILDSTLVEGPLMEPLPGNPPFTPYSISYKNIFTCNMVAMPDNSLRIGGSFQALNNPGIVRYTYLSKIDAAFNFEWCRALGIYHMDSVTSTISLTSQLSLFPLSNNRFLFGYPLDDDPNYTDSLGHGLFYGLINDGPLVSLDQGWLYKVNYASTGYEDLTDGTRDGWISTYANEFIEAGGSYVYNFSAPNLIAGSYPNVGAGFLMMSSEGDITDTIPISIPDNYKIISCTRNGARFLLMAYQINILDGTSSYSAAKTLFLTGGSDWLVTEQFRIQNFYSDFFPSAAATTDGGFVIMGRIQSFNGPSNKLVLIKLKI